MKKKFEKIGLMLLAVAIFLSCNDAADTDSDYEDSLRRDSIDRADMTTTVTDTVAKQDGDAQWVSEVLESNYAEIAFAKQAQQKATNSEVKNLATMLEKDHMALVNEAKDLASKKNWTVATAETSDDMKKREDMMDEDVNKYQKDWLEMMEDKHERSIKKFEDAADDDIDADLKTWINNTIPKLRAHHDKIMQVQKNVK